MASSYYDLDDILTTEELLKCTLRRPAARLGMLELGNLEADLPEGAKLELPLYLAYEFAKKGWIDVELPKFYGEPYLKKLQAGAALVPLKEWCPNYYRLALHLARMLTLRSFEPPVDLDTQLRNLVPQLSQAFMDRYRTIAATDDPMEAQLAASSRLLATEEQSLVQAKAEAAKCISQWRKRTVNEALLDDRNSRLKRRS